MGSASLEKGAKGAKGPRHAAFSVLNRVVAGDAYADILLDAELPCLNEADRALATEITYGVLRWQLKLDWIIDSFSAIKTKKLENTVLNALRIGVYQLFFLSKVPASAAVNESVNLIKPEGDRKAGFVNAVLRKADSQRDSVKFPDIKKDAVRHVSIVYSHPEWIVSRWIERYGINGSIELLSANLTPPPKTIRVNTLKMTRDALIEELTKEGLIVKGTEFSHDGITVLEGGARLKPKDPRYYIQDEASQVIPYLLDPAPGETVLDACSAPGGKTTHIAQMMRNSGVIYAVDKYAGRLSTLEESAKRLGATIIRVMEADSVGPLTFTPPVADGFDAILCDAPCSGLGVLRRSPDIKLKRKEEDLKELSERQTRLLANLSGYLKKGGRIVYSACTLEPEETEAVIREFLKAHRDFALEDAGAYLPVSCRPLVDDSGFLMTFPHRHGMDGFFAARLRRR